MRSKTEHAAALRRHARPLIASLAAAVSVLCGPVKAEPLAKDACETLKSEQVALVGTGLRADMARGVAWAKSNLAADRLQKIARLIEVDEQLLFRCPAPPSPIEAAAKSAPKPDPAKPAKPPTAARAKVTGAKADGGEKAAESGGALVPQAASVADRPKKPTKAEADKKRAAAAAKARSKIKADDAFVPPPDAPISTLQAPAAAGQPKTQ